MPTIDVSYKDMCDLIGKKVSLEELKDKALLYVKGEIDSQDGDALKIDIADTNRPELWSAEGISREIRSHLGLRTGLSRYKMKPSGVTVVVDKNLKEIRPFTACAVVRNANITEEALLQMIQLQEKICMTYGKKRQEVAIGVYDLHKITQPITYKAFKPKELSFVPLEMEEKLTLAQILVKHPKGREFGHLLEGKDRYPIFIDKKGEVLSMPPIINSNHTGKVTTDTKDLFIECSGSDYKFLLPALSAVVTALGERGGTIGTVKIKLPDGKSMVTPDLEPKKMTFPADYVARRSGLDLKNSEMISLIRKSGMDAKAKGKDLIVEYPAYRQDILHPADIVEDILIGYDYNSIEPEIPEITTLGRLCPTESFIEDVSQLMVGLGSQEVLSYTLTDKENLFAKMLLPEERVIEIDNAVSKNWSVFRTWLVPSLMDFLSKNRNREYPQRIFEIGQVVRFDAKAETRTKNPEMLAWAEASADADYTRAKQAVDFLMGNLGLEYTSKPADHPSFIPGRAVELHLKGKRIGLLGEVAPGVLKNWDMEMPVAAFEIDLSMM